MPSGTDYLSAMQGIQKRLKDPNLKTGIVEMNSRGLPSIYSGGFASVFKIKTQKKVWAVKLFYNPNDYTKHRYISLTKFLKRNPGFMLDFEYQDSAILVEGKWLPLLKMEWANGVTLDIYIKKNLGNPSTLLNLSQDFTNLASSLKSHGVAHGDLQHANIIVTTSGLKIIDYDGLYCQETSLIASKELGSPGYQHPSRKASDYGINMDKFSIWIIYLSIQIIAIDKSFFNGNDVLIFENDDFLNHKKSNYFSRLIASKEPQLNAMGKFIIEKLLTVPLNSIPEFNPLLLNINSTSPLLNVKNAGNTKWWEKKSVELPKNTKWWEDSTKKK